MGKSTLESLSESMFYVLLALLKQPRCGKEISDYVADITHSRRKSTDVSSRCGCRTGGTIMNYKYVFQRAEPYEFPALEAYLHEMSEKGWQLDHIFAHSMRFVRGEKSKHYAVVLQKHQDPDNPYAHTEDTKKLQDLLDEFSLEYVCGYANMQVFSSDQPCTLYNEIELQKQTVLKLSRSSLLSNLSLVLIVLLMSLLFLIVDVDMRFSKFYFLANVNAWLLCLLYLTLLLYSLLQYLPYRKFKQTGIYTSDPTIFNGRKAWFTWYPILVYGIASLFMNTYIVLICLGLYFIMQILGMWFPAHYKKLNIICFIAMSFTLTFRPYTFTIVPYHMSEPYEKMVERISLDYDRFFRSSSPFAEIEYVEIDDTPALIHYTIKDSFLHTALSTSMFADYQITEGQFQTECSFIEDTQDLSLYDRIYASQSLNGCYPMLILPVSYDEVWLIPGIYTEEEAKALQTEVNNL